METVQEILHGVFENGLRSPYTKPDTVALAKFNSDVEEMIEDRADRIRRASLVERIRGLELEWDLFRHHYWFASTEFGRFRVCETGDGFGYGFNGGMLRHIGRSADEAMLAALKEYRLRAGALMGLDEDWLKG